MTKNLPKLPFGSMAFSVVVDYAKSKEQMVKETGFYPTLNAWKVPISGLGTVDRLLYLVPFFKPNFFIVEAKALLEKLGLQPAKAEDILALLRDHKEKLKSRKVRKAVAFGTVWDDWVMSFADGLVGGGYISNTWGGGGWYLLALAEDGIRRKIHKTPRPDLPYPQPKPWFKLPEVKPKTKGKQNREQAKARILKEVPKALFFEIEVDYTQSAAEMVKASGFGYNGENECNADTSVIPVVLGKPEGKPGKVKKEIALINLSVIPGPDDLPTTKILSFLEGLDLSPAFAEDFLAFLRDYGKRLDEFKLPSRLLALGTRWQGKKKNKEALRLSYGGDLYSFVSNSGEETFGRSHWVLAHFN